MGLRSLVTLSGVGGQNLRQRWQEPTRACARRRRTPAPENAP